MEGITNVDCTHTKRVWNFEINNTLLLADVFENFRKTCLKINKLDPAKFPSAPGLAWQTALRRLK